MNRKRVLVVGPDLSSHGGIALVNRTYANAGLFSEHGDLDVRYFPSVREGSSAGKLLYSCGRLAAFLAERMDGNTLVHLHVSTGASFARKRWYARIARARGARVLVHVHPTHFAAFHDEGSLRRRRTIERLFRGAAAVVTLTQDMAKLIERIAHGTVVHVLPNPVSCREVAGAPEAPRREPARILYLGWYVARKGIFDLVEAIARLRVRRPSLKAVFGGTKRRDEVLGAVHDRGLDGSVTVHGWLDRDRALRELRSCTMLVLPSHSEGIPMVLLEAMACGAPIVTCPVGGIPEILEEGRNALFVAPGDVESLAAAIADLLDDPDKRDAFSRASRQDAWAFDVEVLLPRLLELYRDCFDGASS